jgi:hypothetical protein
MQYKTKLYFLLVLLLPVLSHAIDKKKAKLIVPGRWREVARMLPDSTLQPFTDTLYIAFLPKDSFSFHHRKGFIYEGVYTINEDSVLDMGYGKYRVVSRKPALMVLSNQKGIYKFEVDKSDTSEVILIKKEDSARPVTNIDVMIGKWTVYKRVADGPRTVDQSENIRSVYITGPSTDGKQGYIYSGTDADNYPSWYIKELGGGQTLNCDGRNPRTLIVARCQDGEMILEEEGMKYFLKQPK